MDQYQMLALLVFLQMFAHQGAHGGVMSNLTEAEMKRYYWSMDDATESSINPMSTNITSIGAAGPILVPGVKKLAFQVETHLYHDIALPELCIYHDNCSSGYTFGMWVKVAPPGGGWSNRSYTLVSSGGEDPESVGFWIGMFHGSPSDTSNVLQVITRNPVSVNELSTTPISLTSWTHLALIIELDDVALFVNGAIHTFSVNATERVGNWTTNHSKLRIGQSIANSGAPREGVISIDEIHFFETVSTTGDLSKLKEVSGTGVTVFMKSSFEGIYVNEIVEGNHFGKITHGNVSLISGRQGFAISLEPNAAVDMGTYRGCFSYPVPATQQASEWCEFGFTYVFWVRVTSNPALEDGEYYIFGNLDLTDPTPKSGFQVVYELSGTSCTFFTYYHNEKTMHRAEYSLDTATSADACVLGRWSRILVTYNKILVGYYKLDSEIMVHNTYKDMFSLPPTFVSYIMPDQHTVYIGHPTHGGSFDMDEMYFHGVMMYLVDADGLGKRFSTYQHFSTLTHVINGTLAYGPTMYTRSSPERNGYRYHTLVNEAVYLNGIDAWIDLKRSSLKSGWVDPQENSGFSLRMWIYQHGCKEDISEAYYIDSGALHYTTWGYAVYYKDDRLHVVVNTQKYEWRASFFWAFEQWVSFVMSWVPQSGFKVWLNGAYQGYFQDKVYRPGIFSRIYPGNQHIFIGRPNMLDSGNEASLLAPMRVHRFVVRDIVLVKPYLLKEYGISYPSTQSYKSTAEDMTPSHPYSRYMEDSLQDFNSYYNRTGTCMAGHWGFSLHGSAEIAYRNTYFKYGARFDGGGYMKSQDMIYNCMSHPQLCNTRRYMIVFWLKPLNWTDSGINSQTLVWIGVKTQPIITITRINANTIQMYWTYRDHHCWKRIPNIADEEWNHIQYYWESYEHGRRTGGHRAWRNGHGIGGNGWCGWKTRREDPTHPVAHIVVGAQPAEPTMTNYTNYAYMEIDDFRIRTTFRSVPSGVRGEDWYPTKGHWLHRLEARYDYVAKSCTDYVKIAEFPSGFNYYRVILHGTKQYDLICRHYPETEITETEVVVRDNYGRMDWRNAMDLLGSRYKVDIAGATALKKASAKCRQYVKYSCKNGGKIFNNAGRTFWRRTDWQKALYWGGSDEFHPFTCACGITKTCRKLGSKCNCDGTFENALETYVDDGYLTETDYLPVRRMEIERGADGTWGEWRVGNFICQDIDPLGMRWRYDDFDLRGEDPSQEGKLEGNRTDEMIIKGATSGNSKALALNTHYENNYVFYRGAIAPQFVDLSTAILGFSSAFFVRIVNRTDVIIISNMEPDLDGFAFYQDNGTCIFLVRYKGYEWEMRTVLALSIWNHVTMTWRENYGAKLYINKADLKTLGAFYDHRVSRAPPTNATNLFNGLYVGIDPIVGYPGNWTVGENPVTAEIALDDMRFAPEYVYKTNIINLIYQEHEAQYNTTFDAFFPVASALLTEEIFWEADGDVVQYEGVVGLGSAFRLPGLPHTTVSKMYQYECAGFVSLCEKGFTLSFWSKLNVSYWDTNDNYTLYSTLGLDEPETSLGIIIYFSGRNGVMEIRWDDLAAGKRVVTTFDLPLDVFFHFVAITNLNGFPTIYINGFEIPTTSYSEPMTIVQRLPPNSLASFGWSPLIPGRHTEMSVDDMVFEAYRIVPDITLKPRYRIGTKWYNFTMETENSGDITMDINGMANIIYGRVGKAISLRQGSYLKSYTPFYSECLADPRRCVEGFTISFWLFVRPSLTTGYIISAFNETNNQGFYLSYLTLGNGNFQMRAQVSWPSQDDFVQFEIPQRSWTHIGIFWTATASRTSSLWINGVKQSGLWTEAPRTPTGNVTDADVWLVFAGLATDEGVTGVSDMAIDEVYFREKWDRLTVVQEYLRGASSNDVFKWSLDTPTSGGYFGAMNIPVYSQNTEGHQLSYEGSAVILDRDNQDYLNLGSFPGTCLSDIDFCKIKFSIFFLLNFTGGGLMDDEQYIISKTTPDSLKSGFYVRYTSRDPRIPFARYFEFGVLHNSRWYKRMINMEYDTWAQVEMSWSYDDGLKIIVDKVPADSEPFGLPLANIENATATIPLLVGEAITGGLHATSKVDHIHIWGGEVGQPPNLYVREDKYHLGCHYHWGMPASKIISSAIMNPEMCRKFCGMPYRKMGISLGLLCFCIPDNWFAFDTVDSANCTDTCPGNSYPCGNSMSIFVFDMYRTTAQTPVPNVEPIIGCRPVIYGPYDNLSLPYFLVNANETFDVEIICDSGNKITFNFSMGAGDFSIEMNNTINYTYTGDRTYNASVYLKNLFTDFLVTFEVISTFPLEEITGLTMNVTDIAAARSDVPVHYFLETGNGIYCDIDYGDGQADGRNQRYYHPDYHHTHFFQTPDTYTIHITCSNNISSVNVNYSIMIMEEIIDLQIKPYWLFDINQVKTIQWQYQNGSHFEYEAEVSGMPMPITYRSLQVNANNALFPTIGWYDGWLRTWNLVSPGERENFTVRIERYVAGLSVACAPYVSTVVEVSVSLVISGASNVNFTIGFENGGQNFTSDESGDLATGHAEPFATNYTQNGTYIITGYAGNALNVMSTTFTVIAQHPVWPLLVYVKNQSSLFSPIKVDIWQDASKPPATDPTIEVHAQKQGWASPILCYSGQQSSFSLYTRYCNLNESGIYNFTTRIWNQISDRRAWHSVEIGEYITVLDYNVSHSIREIHHEISINVTIDAGVGSICAVNYGDGTVTAWRNIVPNIVMTFYHTYTVPGMYDVLVTATNQISTLKGDCQNCVHVQAPVNGLSITGPFAFTFNTTTRVNWVLTSGTDMNYDITLGGNVIASITKGSLTGYLTIADPAVASLGHHILHIVAWNNVSGPFNTSAEVIFARDVKNLRLVPDAFAVATFWPVNVTYFLDDGTEANVTIWSSGGHVTWKYWASAYGGISLPNEMTFNVPGTYTVQSQATNPTSSMNAPSIQLLIQHAIYDAAVNFTQPDTFFTPMQMMIRLNENNPAPTDLNIRVHMDDGNTTTEANFLLIGDKLWLLTWPYGDDGYYNVSIHCYNSVSEWRHWQVVQIGIPGRNLTVNVNKMILKIYENITVNATVKTGSNLRLKYEWGDGNEHETNLSAEYLHDIYHHYPNPGLYELVVSAWNAFGDLVRRFANYVIVQEVISGVTFSSDKKVYRIGSGYRIKLSWTIPVGTNASCRVTFGGPVVYQNPLCPTSIIFQVPWSFRSLVDEYNSTLEVWNLVTPTIEKNLSVLVERPVTRPLVTPQDAVWPIRTVMNVTIDVVWGSNKDVLAYYSDVHNSTATFVSGDDYRTKWIVRRDFMMPGTYTLYAKASNLINTRTGMNSVVIQTPVYDAQVNVTLPDEYQTPLLLLVDYNIGDMEPTDITMTINYGDGSPAGTNPSFSRTGLSYWLANHMYPDDGIYNVTVTAVNRVSTWTKTQEVQIGKRIRNVTLTAVSYILSTVQPLSLSLELHTGSNVIIDYDYGDGVLTQTTGVNSGMSYFTQHLYTIPGVYQVLVNATNVFGEVFESMRRLVYIDERINSIMIWTDGSAYAIERDNVTVHWIIRRGSNITAKFILNGDVIHEISDCSYTSVYVIQTHMFPNVSENSIKVEVTNLVTIPLFGVSEFLIERPVEYQTIVSRQAIAPRDATVYFDIYIRAGSNFQIIVSYTDGYVGNAMFYTGDVFDYNTTDSRTFTEAGDYTVYMTTTNPLGRIKATTEVTVQGPVDGLVMTTSDIRDVEIQAVVNVSQLTGYRPATHMILDMDWGDGRVSTFRDAEVSTSSPMELLHRYYKEGAYSFTLTAYNAISSQTMTGMIKVGEAIEGFFAYFPDALSTPGINVPFCFNTTRGSNVSVVAVFSDGMEEKLGGTIKAGVGGCLYHRFRYQGFMTANASARNSFSSGAGEDSIFLENSIQELVVSVPRSVIANETAEFTIYWETLGFEYCVLWDLGDGSQPFVYGIADCEDRHPNAIHRMALEGDDMWKERGYYTEKGTYNMSVYAYNRVSAVPIVKEIYVVHCQKPTANLDGVGNHRYRPTSWYRSHRLRLTASPHNPCNIPWNITMNWTVVVHPNEGHSYESVFDQPDLPVLVFPPRYFPLGLVIVTFYIKVGPYAGIEDQETKYINIIPTPLRMGIKGGSFVTKSRGGPCTISAKGATLDPDLEDQSSMTYDWKYREKGKSLWIDWVFTNPGRRKRAISNNPLLTIPQNFLPAGLYEIWLQVAIGTKIGDVLQIISLQDGAVPEIMIGCVENCKQKVITIEKLTLNTSCENCETLVPGGDWKYSWSLFLTSNGSRDLVSISGKTSTAPDSHYLGLKGYTLLAGEYYAVRLTVSLGSYSGVMEYDFLTNSPPYGGSCLALPNRGVAMFDKFAVSCKDWKDEGLNPIRDFNEDNKNHAELTYNFYQKPKGSSSSPSLYYYGPDPGTPELYLTMGNKRYEHTVDITVKIFDSLGEATVVNLDVQVAEFFLKYDELTEKVSGDVTEFDFLLAAKDMRGLTTAINAFTEQLDRREEDNECLAACYAEDATDATSTDAEINEADAVAKQEARKQIRSSLMSLTSKASVWMGTNAALLHGADTVRQLSAGGSEFNSASTDQAIAMLQSLAQSLNGLFDQTPSQIQETGNSLVRGVENLFKIVKPTHTKLHYQTDFGDISPEENRHFVEDAKAKALAEQTMVRAVSKSVVSAGLAVVDRVTLVVLSSRIPDEEAVTLGSPSAQLVIQRQSKKGIYNKVITSGESTIVIPGTQSALLSGYTGAYIDSQMMRLDTNPFTWDDTSEIIKTTIAGLKLFAPDESVIPVAGLSGKFKIELPISRTGKRPVTEISLDKVEERENDLVNHNVSFGPTVNAIKFTITSIKPRETFSLYIKLNEKATDTDYDHRFTMKVSKGYSYVLPVPEDIANGTYYMAIRQDSRRSLEKTEYKLEVSLYGCLYWHEVDDMWITDGCQVDSSTVTTSLKCECNHLTFFGGDFVVAPNTINFDTVFGKFSTIGDNLAVLLTIAAILILYWFVLIFLKRLDKRDVEKWMIRPLLDNSPDDTYSYILTVVTGKKPCAGTRSKIHFVVVGEYGDSDIRVVDDGFNKEHGKGTIHRYLLTVPADLGKLKLLRVWHDGQGIPSRWVSWFCGEVILHDLHKKDNSHFVCNRWLSKDREDGATERVLPLTPPDKLKNFQRLFGFAANKELTDEHLWFSVLSRPHRSNFTRVQRWSCCLSLLFTSMITSAMWYGTIDDEDPGQLIKIGPFLWSTKQFFIAAMTSVIVFPPNFAIIYLFRKSKSKDLEAINNVLAKDKVQRRSSGVGDSGGKYMKSEDTSGRSELISPLSVRDISPSCQDILEDLGTGKEIKNIFAKDTETNFSDSPLPNDQSDNQNSIVDDERNPPKKLCACLDNLPHWCVYIAWVLVALSTVVPAFFCLLYSLEWGSQKSEAWLTCMFIGFLQSVLIVQPIKVILVAVLVSLLFKKDVSEDVVLTSDDKYRYYTDNQAHIKTREKLSRKKEKLLDYDKEDMLHSENKLATDRKMEERFSKLFLYTCYVIVVVIISYGHRDPMAYYTHKHIENTLVGPWHWNDDVQGFKEIESLDSFKVWANEIYLPRMHPSSDYNGDPITDWRHVRYFSLGGEYLKVGPTRFRQLRVKPDACSVPELMAPLISQCEPSYSRSAEEKGSFDGSWTNSAASSNGSDPWTFQTSNSLGATSYWGYVSSYSGNGYAFTHPIFLDDALAEQKSLFSNDWLDELTRAVFVEFTLFNQDANLFAVVNLILEHSPTGGTVPSVEIDVLTLYSYSGNYALFRLAAELIFVIVLIYNIITLARSVYKLRSKHFTGMMSIIDVGSITLGVLCTFVYLIRFGLAKIIINGFHKHDTEVIKGFSGLALYDGMFTCLMALLVFISSLRLLYLLSFSKRVHMLQQVMIRCVRPLIQLGISFAIMMVGFTTVAFCIFGNNTVWFSTFVSSAETLMAAFVGYKIYGELDMAAPIIGRVFFVLFTFSMMWYIGNILIAMLNESLDDVKGEVEADKKREDFMKFLNERLRDLIGFDGFDGGNRTDKKKQKNSVEIQTDDSFSPDNEQYDCSLNEELVKRYDINYKPDEYVH